MPGIVHPQGLNSALSSVELYEAPVRPLLKIDQVLLDGITFSGMSSTLPFFFFLFFFIFLLSFILFFSRWIERKE